MIEAVSLEDFAVVYKIGGNNITIPYECLAVK